MLALDGIYAPTVLRGRSKQFKSLVEPKPYGYYRLVFVLDGAHQVTLGTVSDRVPAGRAYWVLPGVDPQVVLSPGTRTVMLGFIVTATPLEQYEGQARRPVDLNHMQPMPEEIWGFDLPIIFDEKISETLRNGMQRAVAMWYKSDSLYFDTNFILYRMLNKIVTYYRDYEEKDQALANQSSANQASANQAANDARHWVQQVEGIVADQMKGLRNSKDLAAVMGLSPKHLAIKFRQHFGITAAEYLRQERLNKASQLIATTNWSISDIAQEVGYSSPIIFHRAWAQRYSVTPLKWRMQQNIE